MFKTYLSPSGTLTRRAFAVAMLRLVTASLVAGAPLYVGYAAAREAGHTIAMAVCGLSLMTVLFGSAWASLALQIKRLHDQGRRGHSAVAMTLVGLVCAPLLAQLGLDEATGGRAATVLTIAYLAWLLTDKGRRRARPGVTTPSSEAPVRTGAPEPAACPHPACE